MMIWALIALPTLCGLSAFFIRSDVWRRTLLVGTASVHFALVVCAWFLALPLTSAAGWLALDAASLLVLSISSGLFLAASLYAIGYLKDFQRAPIRDYLEGFEFSNRPERIFIGCLLLFLAAMTGVAVSIHLGLLWVAVEATTLASAPLIYYHRHHRSLEAAWKYLLICSVGIALALLGNFFMSVAVSAGADREINLLTSELIKHARQLSPAWLKASFLLMLVGYGTKMGLAPMHTWLPDAHSESPSLVSALLSGALLNCAFLAIARMHGILDAAGMGDFSRQMLLLFGLISMVWAAMLMISQTDYKRLLAYSSVEHMGVMAVGMGVGATSSVMLHAVNHSLAKASLFLVAGNILAAFRSKSIQDVEGIFRFLPLSGILWIAGFLAITGIPPFGLFISELLILKAALAAGRWLAAVGYLVALGIAFAAIAWGFMQMAFGQKAQSRLQAPVEESFRSVAVPLVLIGGVLVLGVWIPDPLWRFFIAAAEALTGGGF
ncbi:MAG: hydrogenase [Desulfobacterales bacterium]|jgi:hydrogenase-4 component F|nr:hydrogenase [Desulfobacterales bacterium]